MAGQPNEEVVYFGYEIGRSTVNATPYVIWGPPDINDPGNLGHPSHFNREVCGPNLKSASSCFVRPL
jgi:hypothetical protein